MSTRSLIGMETKDKDGDKIITYIYCHYDGYPDNMEGLLANNYKKEKALKELLDLGDLSSLGETLDSTVAYHRDRGENKRDTKASIAYSKQGIDNHASKCGADYSYILFDGQFVTSKY